MKNVLRIMFVFILSILTILAENISFSHAQEIMSEEILFDNKTSGAIYVTCFPISLIFNADSNYTLQSKNFYRGPNSNIRFDYNNTVYLLRNLPDTSRAKKTHLRLRSSVAGGYQVDFNDGSEVQGSVGFGKYKIIFSYDEERLVIIDTLTLEFDAGYGSTLGPDVIFSIYTNGRISFSGLALARDT